MCFMWWCGCCMSVWGLLSVGCLWCIVICCLVVIICGLFEIMVEMLFWVVGLGVFGVIIGSFVVVLVICWL